MRPAGCAHPFCDGTEKGAGSASRFDNSQFVKRTVRRITHQIEDEFDHPAASEDLSVFRCVIDIEPTRHASGSFLDKLIMVDRKITKSISDLG